MKRLLLADAGFLIGLADEHEACHPACLKYYNEKARLILAPWPLYYESLRSRNLGNRRYVEKIVSVLKDSPVQTVDDVRYRDEAAERMRSRRGAGKNYSLVDWVVRLIILDMGEKIGGLLTVDPKDFEDVCAMKNVKVIDLKRACE